MLQFERFRLSVYAHSPATNENKLFGCDITLRGGLNFIVGKNTSGKTSIVKCFYYAIGMEELIETKRGTDSLDKSVKDQFAFERNGKDEIWYVSKSFIEVKLGNQKDEHIILKRHIKQDGITPQNTIYVKRKVGDEVETKQYFLHNTGDHNPPNGFYQMLAEFAGLDLMYYQGIGDEDVLMYMQTVFALSFVEQTKGWSEFFSNIVGLNMFHPRQRLIEYALNVETNNELINKRKLQDNIKSLDTEWKRVQNEVNNATLMNDLIVAEIGTLKEQKSRPESISIGSRDSKDSIERHLYKLRLAIEGLKKDDTTETESEKVARYKELKKDFDELSEKYKTFIEKYNSDRNRLASVVFQLDRLEEEIKKNRNLIQVTNLITSDQIDYCPVCHQTMPIQTDSVNIDAHKDDLERNVKQLLMQRSFLESIKTRLEKSLEEKGIYNQYYEQMVEDKKLELDAAFEEMGDNAKVPSRHTMYKLAENRLRYSRIAKIVEKKKGWEAALQKLFDEYVKLQSKLNEMKGVKKNTLNQKLIKLETTFSELAVKYGYSSNGRYLLGLLMEEKSGYCYFPIVQYSEKEWHPVRSMSSASDFVRCIWAYYTTLLQVAERHPGFMLFDEPCQQSMSEASLKALFKHCSSITNRQVLLFCSSSPKTEESENSSSHQKTIDEMLAESNLKEGEDYCIHHINTHSVDELEPIKKEKKESE